MRYERQHPTVCEDIARVLFSGAWDELGQAQGLPYLEATVVLSELETLMTAPDGTEGSGPSLEGVVDEDGLVLLALWTSEKFHHFILCGVSIARAREGGLSQK